MKPSSQVRSAFIQPYSAALRIWHWLSFLVTLFLIVTVLAAEFVYDKEEGAAGLQNDISASGVTVTATQAEKIAQSFTVKIWDLHTYLGYALAGLFLFRIVLEFFQPADQRFFNNMRNVQRSNLYMKNRYILTKYIYIVYYILLTVISVTGLLLALNRDKVESELHEVKEVHEISYYLLLIFLLLHLGGVIWAEIKHSKGIVSNMINGGKNIES